MTKPHQDHARVVPDLVLVLSLLLAIPCSFTLAQPPITPSGLNTQVNLAPTPPPGKIQYDITGGTRLGGGPNLFHSFGDFNVPNNDIANFLNDSGLATSNILGRVTGGNLSTIFGTIQTTGFGTANLFLMNPAGFLFGPNATVNVGGMVSFTSADYLRLADGARFNASPHAHADALLSIAPVAAFGFLGSNPGAITVQGSQLTVAEGTGISLVGGNIIMQSGTLDNGTVQAAQLSAPSGPINLVSVGRPSHPHVGGEVVIAGAGAGFTPTGFATLGTISLSQGSTVDTSGIAGSGHAAGSISIRGGQFVMDNSSLTARPDGPNGTTGNIGVTADQVALSNHSTIDTSTAVQNPPLVASGVPGTITFNANTFLATDSTISAVTGHLQAPVATGAVTIQGLQGSGSSAQAVSLTNTGVSTASGRFGSNGGPSLIRADNIALNQSRLDASSFDATGGAISLLSRGALELVDSFVTSQGFLNNGGTVDLRSGSSINATNTFISTLSHFEVGAGPITLVAPVISLSGSTLTTNAGASFLSAGSITLTGTKAVSLTNGTVLSTDATNPGGGTILINGGAKFTSDHSTISAQSQIFGNGGTIQVKANKVELTDSQLTTSVTGGPQTVGGHITVDAKNTTLTNSQLLSTATQGQGGTIDITTHVLHQDASSVIDASSQSGTNGTVTINGVIQP